MKVTGGVLFVPWHAREVENHAPRLDLVLAALEGAERYGWQVMPEELSAEHDAYYRALSAVWERCVLAGCDLMIVEQDVVIHEKVLDGLAECASGFCSYPYWIGASYAFGLGCVRFRYRFLSEFRPALTKAGEIVNDGIPERGHWKRLDTRLYLALKMAGEQPCRHEPPVRHEHKYPMPDPEGDMTAMAEFRRRLA